MSTSPSGSAAVTANRPAPRLQILSRAVICVLVAQLVQPGLPAPGAWAGPEPPAPIFEPEPAAAPPPPRGTPPP